MSIKIVIHPVTSLAEPELAIYTKCSEPELTHYYEPALGIFIAESPMIIERALAAGYEPLSMLIEEGKESTAQELLSKYSVSSTAGLTIHIYSAPLKVITELTGFNLTRGLLCAFRRKELPSIADTIKSARRIAVLEDVMNPTNLGAIFRCAAALSVDAVLLTSHCTDPLYRRSARVSMGSCFLIPWTYLDTPNEDYINVIHSYGFKTVAMALRSDSHTINDQALHSEPKLAIIMGTEGEGLRSQTIEASDYTVKIPMSHGVDSLNVAAASAIAFYALCT